jgi:hypothetical protein
MSTLDWKNVPQPGSQRLEYRTLDDRFQIVKQHANHRFGQPWKLYDCDILHAAGFQFLGSFATLKDAMTTAQHRADKKA